MSNDATTMYLIRHGATAHNVSRPVKLQGNGINGPLNETGQQQAADLGQFFANRPLAAVYASPMLRAQQTAGAIASQRGLEVQAVAPLHEVDVGSWEGMTWPEIMEAEPTAYEKFMTDPNFPYRDGESFADVLARVKEPLNELLTRHVGESFAVVAHNVVNRVYIAELLGRGLENSRKIRQMNCCVNVIRAKDGAAELVTMNSLFHLRDW